MSAPLSCTRCGYQNQPGYQYCSNCGAPLSATAGVGVPYGAPAPGPYAAPAYVPYPGSVDYERTRQIDRTKTGVLLLLIGSLLTAVPIISVVGFLLIFIGVILVIVGRKAFGPIHSRNILVSIVLFIVGILVVIAVAVIGALANIGSVIGPGGTVNITPAFLAATASSALLAGIASAIILGIAEVLFTYALQAQNGRLLLWAAYGANIALAIALYLLLSPLYRAVVTTGDYNAVAVTQQTYSLLNAIPALLFAGADYLAWSRISRREIPGPSLAPMGMPPTMPPPSPPSPPPTPPPSGPAPPINPQ